MVRCCGGFVLCLLTEKRVRRRGDGGIARGEEGARVCFGSKGKRGGVVVQWWEGEDHGEAHVRCVTRRRKTTAYLFDGEDGPKRGREGGPTGKGSWAKERRGI
jgi:hypothetical protein